MLPIIGGVVVVVVLFGGAATLLNAMIENKQKDG